MTEAVHESLLPILVPLCSVGELGLQVLQEGQALQAAVLCGIAQCCPWPCLGTCSLFSLSLIKPWCIREGPALRGEGSCGFHHGQRPIPRAVGRKVKARPSGQAPGIRYPLCCMQVSTSLLCGAPASRCPSWLCGNPPDVLCTQQV